MKPIKCFMIFVFLCAVFGACNKDDEEISPNQIIINGQSKRLTEGQLWENSIGPDDNGVECRYFGVFLVSEGLINTNSNFYTGTGTMLSIAFWSSSTTQLVDGTYPINDHVLVNKSLAAVVGYTDSNVTSFDQSEEGFITTKHTGTNYTITFSFKARNSENVILNVSGSFTGPLPKGN